MTDIGAYHRKLGRVLDRMGAVYTLGDIMERLDDGRMQSFSHGNSMLVTQVNVYPRARALDFLLAVGDLKDWPAIHDDAVAFADAHDISLIRAYGRRGWMPFIRDHGWRSLTTNQVYVKEL
jgi:hypothetical protein